MIVTVLAALAAAAVVGLLTGVISFNTGKKKGHEEAVIESVSESVKETRRQQETKKAVKEALEENAATSSPPPPSTPPAPSPLDPSTYMKWNEYPEVPWPGAVSPGLHDVDPQNSRIYVSPPKCLADGKMYVRVYIYGVRRDGKPASLTPFILVDPGNVWILEHEVGHPHTEGDLYPWNENVRPEEEGESLVTLEIESDKDEDYCPYGPNGAYLDEFGEWEGRLWIRETWEDEDRDEDVAFKPRIGGRTLYGPQSMAVVEFKTWKWFEQHPEYLEYLPNRLKEERFEELARTRYGGRGTPIEGTGEKPEK